MTIIDLPDEAATAALAAAIAGVARRGDVIALGGGLGAGKTAFARAFIRARAAILGRRSEEDVPSPTFTLVQTYELPDVAVWHFDCYRLRGAEEAWELGIEEAFHDGISLLAWPDRGSALLPAWRLAIELLPGDSPDSRRARLDGGGDWPARLREAGLDG